MIRYKLNNNMARLSPEEIRYYRNLRPKNQEEAREQARKCIERVVQAFYGLLPKEKIQAAIGKAKSPNAVSRALRSRLPPLK
jgi:hypothetical protein